MYLIGNLVSECFPETARIFYGLSKSEFANEPEIAHLAVKHGLLKSAVATGHVRRIREMLADKRLDSSDLAESFALAMKKKDVLSMNILSEDMRFDPTHYRVGRYESSIARLFLENPRFPMPTHKDVVRAAFGPHGGKQENGQIVWNDLSTLEAVLSDPRLILHHKFCQDLCETVSNILVDNSWKTEGVLCPIPLFKKNPNYVCYTNMRRLVYILMHHKRFAAFAADLEEAYWQSF
jgi:hypothetical protein